MRAAKRYRRILLISMSVTLLVATALIVIKTQFYWNGDAGDISCHYRKVPNEIPDTENPEFSPPKGRSIFFHETSCKSSNGAVTLSPRQACAVESAALMNPEYYIYVLFSASIVWNMTRGNGTLDKLLEYKNVRIARLQLENYAKGTPLEEWMASGALKRSRYRVSHTSDVLRYLTMWKYGGVYLDLDVVVVKPLCGLASNWAGRESTYAIAAGAMSFSRDEDGRRYSEATLRELRTSFRGDQWGNNGPGVITRVLERQCNTKKVDIMSAERCGGFEVYSEEYFYPITWRDWKQYFQPRMVSRVKNMSRPYIFHVWNKHSVKQRTDPNVLVPYTYLASKYCPRVYEMTKDHF